VSAPAFSLDLDAYLARTGCTASREESLATFRALQLAHIHTVPFENVYVLLGRTISMEPAAVTETLVARRRGGYCFEQNTHFREVLCAIGFRVTPLLARVRRNAPPDVRTPLTHMVLSVEIDGRSWLTDVGFGAVGATVPLALDTEDVQPTPHEPHRLVRAGRAIMHQVKLGGDWADVYEFVAEKPAPIDFELGNWFSCTHPKAHFTNNLIVSRVDGDKRLTIFNREFTIRALDGSAEKEDIASLERLLELLAERFGLAFPAGTRIEIPAAPWDR
jgi:N-hydroxyarylamine O-acetyltransferase